MLEEEKGRGTNNRQPEQSEMFYYLFCYILHMHINISDGYLTTLFF